MVIGVYHKTANTISRKQINVVFASTFQFFNALEITLTPINVKYTLAVYCQD